MKITTDEAMEMFQDYLKKQGIRLWSPSAWEWPDVPETRCWSVDTGTPNPIWVHIEQKRGKPRFKITSGPYFLYVDSPKYTGGMRDFSTPLGHSVEDEKHRLMIAVDPDGVELSTAFAKAHARIKLLLSLKPPKKLA